MTTEIVCHIPCIVPIHCEVNGPLDSVSTYCVLYTLFSAQSPRSLPIPQLN